MRTMFRPMLCPRRVVFFRQSWGLLCALTWCCLPAPVARAALAQPIVQQFYVPMPEVSLQTALRAIDTTGTAVGNDLKTTIAIAVGSANTVVVYDQWEDGYENDINNPTQSSTLIWGDGNDANGICPGFAHDPTNLLAGTVIILTNTVSLPRNPAVLTYDGRDHIAATKPVVVTRVGWGVVPGTVLMSGGEVYDTTRWGTAFEIPVGTNTTPTIQNFSYSSLFIMASQSGTVVQVDTNGDAIVDLTVTLNQGDNYFVNGGVQSGATITASKPVQVHEVTGRIGSTYQSRTFAIRPTAQWDSSYYAPVGTSLASETHNVFLFNPYTTNLLMRCDTRTGTTNVTVPANGNYKFPMPLNSGAHFYTTNSVTFYAVGANDTGGAASGNATHDWGYSLLPATALTTVAVAGWAPGSDGTPPTGNGSPLWVTPTQPTTVYVNYSGNPTNGPLIAPNGQKYNASYAVTAFQSQTIYSPTPTNNLSGARLFTVDGATFTAAWGEDSSKAGAGSPYMDVGTSIIPFPVPVITKSCILAVDADTNGQFSPGDTVEYTIRVSNQGMLELGNVLVLDPLPASLTYVANSTKLNGVALADNLVPPAATAFPLDESGLTLQNIPVAGYSEIKYRTLINQGATSITNFVATTTGDSSQTNSATVPIVATNAPTPTCAMAFSDSAGNTVTTYAPNASLYVIITNSSLNTQAGTAETVTVLVKNNANGDQEYLALTETGVNTGVFRNSAALTSSATSGVSQQDGTLYAQSGQTLEVDLANSICSAAFATVSTPAAIKKLYLSDPNQALDRIDPVASNDTTATNTAVLGGSTSGTGIIGAAATTQAFTANAASLTFSHTPGTGPNRLLVVALGVGAIQAADTPIGGPISGVTFGGVAMTLAANTNIVPARSYIYTLVNPPSGAANVVVTAGSASSIAAGATTFTNVNQTTPLGNSATNGSSGSTTLSVVVSSASGELVVSTADWDYGAVTQNTQPAAGQTALWTTNGNYLGAAASTKPGAASVTNTFTSSNSQQCTGVAVALKPAAAAAISGTSFTQAPSLCNPLALPSGGAVTITNYIANITGTLPANPDVTAVLSYGTTPFIVLGSPTYYSAAGILVWSGTLSSNVTIAAGQAITYAVTNNSATYSFQINYDSTSYPAAISLPTTTIINVDLLGFYTAAYPGATVAASALSGQTVYIRATVSDPFGSNDVNRCLLTITDPASGVTSVTLSNAQLVANDTCTRTYEYAWLAGATVGAYSFRVDAFEGTEGITNSRLATLFVSQLDLGTPSTTQFTASTNGVQTNSYYAGTNIWVRVTDLNRNTNATTSEIVTAVITVSTGDRETITLTETGTNTGIFIGFLPANTSAATLNNGTLNVLAGATLTVTYTDATDATDVTSDTATIKPANAANPAVSVLKTLVSPASGLAAVGSTVQFNLQVANSGSITVTNVTLSDTNLSTQYLLTSASLTPTSNGTNAANVVSNVWNNLGPLAVGASTNISVFFKVLGAGSLTNYAMVTGSATNGPASASVTGYQTSLTIAKSIVTPASGTGYIGNTVVFRIALTNTGTTILTNLPLEDSYSAGALQYVSASLTPAGAGGGQILWTNLGSLAVGAATNIYVTNTAVGVSSPTVNNAAVNYGTDANGYAVPPVQTATNLYIIGASIGTNVWFDANANGVYDAGDSALSGVIVFIDANNDGIRQSSETFVTTDSNGAYLLASLAAGTYVVRVDTNTLPSGVRPTYDLDGTNTAHVATVTLASGQNLTTVNFGYTGSGSIGGYVWFDADGSGVTNGFEPALTGVRVFIDANGNGQWETNEICVTNVAGYYTFSNLAVSAYNIAVDYSTLPAGAACTGDPDATKNGATTVTLAAGQSVASANFGFQGNARIAGSVLVDANGNGAFDAADTNGVSGVTVILQTASGVSLATNITSVSGAYSFTNFFPGNYVVVETDLPGWLSTADTVPPNDNQIALTLISGQVSTGNNFLDTQLEPITGSVKLDVNGNGLADPEDTNAVAPVVIKVYTNGITLVATVTNNSSGSYTVTNLAPGSYTVVQTTMPPGYVPTTTTNVAVALTSGSPGMANFLDLVTFSLGNKVFKDLNNDGNMDYGENGISNVVMVLFTNNAGSPFGSALQTISTDTNGDYRFDGLRAGSYVVVVDKANSPNLVGYVSSTGYSTNTTLTGQFIDHGIDTPLAGGSVLPGGIAITNVTVGLGLQPLNEVVGNPVGMGQHGPSGDSFDNLVIDFGFTPTYSIGNRVFNDNGASGGTAGDGIQNGGEGGIAGVGVQLLTNGVTVVATTNTDASGYYRFDNLPDGTYTVFLPTTNFTAGGALIDLVSSTVVVAGDKGNKGIYDSSPSTHGIGTASIIVGLGLQPTSETDTNSSGAAAHGPSGDAYDNLTIDFGMITLSGSTFSIGNRVFLDNGAGSGTANNGVQDGSEPGIANVTVQLKNNAGTVVATTTTDASGYYRFDGLAVGPYSVFLPATDFGSSAPLAGLLSDSSVVSGDKGNKGIYDANPSANGVATASFIVSLDSKTGESDIGSGAGAHGPNGDSYDDLTIDFGMVLASGPYSIGNRVFNDNGAGTGGRAGDGLQNGTEPGISGVTVQLKSSGGTVLTNTTTDSSGDYQFINLPAGTYTVFLPASNFAVSAPLVGKYSSTTTHAGDQGNKGIYDSNPSANGIGAASVTIASDNLTIDFGFVTVAANTYSLGNLVFRDPDDDGQPDIDNLNEGGISGVSLAVFVASGGEPTGSALAWTTTDSEGFYRFDGLAAGTYVVVVDKTNSPLSLYRIGSYYNTNTTASGDRYNHGKSATVTIGGITDGIPSVPVTVGSGLQPVGESTSTGTGANGPNGDASDNLTLDFGFAPYGSLGNRVFLDNGAGTGGVANDGIQNGTEPGISNVVMVLFTNNAGNPFGSPLATTTTDTNGYYRFDGLVHGTYVVVVDAANSASALAGLMSSTGATTDGTITGDKHDHGIDTPLDASSVLVGGIASTSVTVQRGNIVPVIGETLGTGAGANGPNGDDSDNLVMDFGFAPAVPSAYQITAATTTPTAGVGDALTIKLVNAAGDVITSFTGDTNLTFSGLSSANGTPTVTNKTGTAVALGSTVVIHFVNGVSSSDSGAGILTAYKAETATLNVTDGNSSSTSTGGVGLGLTISSAAASQLVYTSSAVTTTAGVASSTITVERRDAYGNPATSGTTSVTLSSSSTGTVTFSSGSPVSINSGASTASFTYTDQQAGTPTVTAASSGLTSATQGETVNPAAVSAAHSVISASPTAITANGTSTSTITVTEKDAYGNSLTASGGLPVLSTSAGSLGSVTDNGNGTYTATLTSATTAGTANVTGTIGGTAIGTSASVVFTPGAPTHLVFVVQPTTTTAGTAISPSVTVYVEDANGNVVTNDNSSVTISGTTFTGGSTLTVAVVNGVATFSGLHPTTAGSGLTLTASDGELTGATSAPFTVNAAAASQLVVTTQPGNGTGGSALATQPVVTLADPYGNTVKGTAQDVTVAIYNNAGGGTLSGTATVAVDTGTGAATFSGLSIDKVGTGYTLTVTGSTVNPSAGTMVSSGFDITAGAAARLVFTTQPSSSTVAGVAFATQPVVTIEDALGNTVTSGVDSTKSVVLTLSTGAGALGGTTAMNAVAGVANFSGKGLSISKVGVNKGLTATVTLSGPGEVTTATSPPFAITLPPINILRGPGAGVKIHVSSDLLVPDATWDDSTPLTYESCDSASANSVSLAISGEGSSTLIVYPSSAANVADSFQYTIGDTNGDTWTGTVNISLNLTLTSQQATISVLNGVATMTFYGVPDYHYAVQRTTNVNGEGGWADITVTSENATISDSLGYSVITAPAAGAFTVTDHTLPEGSAYYRLRAAP